MSDLLGYALFLLALLGAGFIVLGIATILDFLEQHDDE